MSRHLGVAGGWGADRAAPRLAQLTSQHDRRPLPLVGTLPPPCVNHGPIRADAGVMDGDGWVPVVVALVAVSGQVGTALLARHQGNRKTGLGTSSESPVEAASTTPAESHAAGKSDLEVATDLPRRR